MSRAPTVLVPGTAMRREMRAAHSPDGERRVRGLGRNLAQLFQAELREFDARRGKRKGVANG